MSIAGEGEGGGEEREGGRERGRKGGGEDQLWGDQLGWCRLPSNGFLFAGVETFLVSYRASSWSALMCFMTSCIYNTPIGLPSYSCWMTVVMNADPNQHCKSESIFLFFFDVVAQCLSFTRA